jgi:nicotianamine synthase
VQAILPSLRNMCAEAECCLEAHWTRYIISGDHNALETLKRMEAFPYYGNYVELTKMELCAICSVGTSLPTKVAFIGSGPLPLTSLCLLTALKDLSSFLASGEPLRVPFLGTTQERNVSILNIDRDEEAINASSALSSKLGAQAQGMHFMQANADSAGYDLTGFDVVYLAALVGDCQSEKENLLVNVARRMRTGALIVVRTSWGLRTVLYPEVDLATERLAPWLEICTIVHPYGSVVNSVIVARVKSHPGQDHATRGA